jgi:hypothetical protein
LLDSYEKFLSEYVSKEKFFNFGLSETIYIPLDKVETEWKELKRSIFNNKSVFIRGFGRGAAGTHLFFDFYKNVFQNDNIEKDHTNNQKPTKLLETLTGFKKNKDIRNYQVSHIFGRTKNIFTFTAPWNIVFMPKLLDPFTGHEAKGDMIDEYKKLFQRQSYEKFKPFIDEFNDIVTDVNLIKSIKNYFEDLYSSSEDIKIVKKFQKAVLEEFSPIELL